MSWKEDFISKHCIEAYEKRLAQMRAYHKAHEDEEKARAKKYKEEHPDEVRANEQESYRKGGKRYEKMLAYCRTGIPGDKKKIRRNHARLYKLYKNLIAPDSQLHHNWQNDGTARYTGIALVEANAHRHGEIDVIQILAGEILVFTEEELRSRGDNCD